MQNFRPPIMDEVQKSQAKHKLLIIITIILIVIGISIGGIIGIKQLKIYLNYVSAADRHKTLRDFYKALANNDTNTLVSIAPTFKSTENYHFQTGNGNYSLFIYPDQQTNKNLLLFQIVDHSVSPSISYLNEVTYQEEYEGPDRILINNIKVLGKGYQIN